MDIDIDDEINNHKTESDDSDEETELEALAGTLENQISENIYSYQAHLELIQTLKKLADLERLRKARNRMAVQFPLTPELWMDWLNDEIGIASTDEENKAVLDLFERAVKDYLSIDIWLRYVEFMKDKFGCTDESAVVEIRKIYERSLIAGGLHVIKGSSLWVSYIEFEKERLKTVEDNHDLLLNQLKLIGNLYKRFLSCPLVDVEGNFEMFCTWLKKYSVISESVIIDRNIVEEIYKKSKYKLQKIKGYEDALISDVDNARKHYEDYIQHEKSKEGSPVRVQSLYERMVCDYCLHEEVWLEYIKYVNSVLKDGDVAVEIIRRSLRNCPWSCRLHQLFIKLLEKYDYSCESITDAFEQAIASGLQTVEDFREIWMSFLEYLRRRFDEPEIPQDEENRRFDQLRANFEKAVEFLSQLDDADPEYEIPRFWARIEAIYGKNMEKSRLLFNEIISNSKCNTSELWLEYIHIERTFGDSKHLRKLYGRALQYTTDFPRRIANSWLNYERDEGTLESYEICVEKIRLRLDEEQNRLDREAAEIRAESEQEQVSARKKPKREAAGSGRIVTEKYSDENRKHKLGGAKRSLQKEDSIEEVEKKKSKKEENEELVEKLLQESQKSHGVTVVHDSSKDNRTVFVSNLDFSTEESTIREEFQACGNITDLRLVKDYKGRSKGYCYVEFENSNSVVNALKKDRSLINMRPMFVSRCDPDRDTREKVFKYSSKMEKNKLFVRGLPFTTSENDLRELFSKYGLLKDIRLVTYRNGHSKGLAYVEYEDEVSAAQAILKTDGMTIGDRNISVAISNPPSRKPETPGLQVSSLGGGSKIVGPRGRGRTQLSFVPRSVQLNPPSQSLADLSIKSPELSKL